MKEGLVLFHRLTVKQELNFALVFLSTRGAGDETFCCDVKCNKLLIVGLG